MFYRKSISETLNDLGTREVGLSSAEAKRNLEKYGKTSCAKRKRPVL